MPRLAPVIKIVLFARFISFSCWTFALLWSLHSANLSAVSSSAEKEFAPVRFQSSHPCAMRHLKALQHCARIGVNSSNVAFVAFPGSVPELAVHPGHSGDKAV